MNQPKSFELKAPNRNPLLAWCDFESTGLNVNKMAVLEVAWIVTDHELNELASYTSPIFCDAASLRQLLTPVVHEMHTKSGLLREIGQAPMLEAVLHESVAFLRKHKCHQATLAGNSVHFDRKILERFMPMIAMDLYYRIVDVSSWTEMLWRWGYEKPPVEDETRRALPDLRRSIALLKHFRSLLVPPPARAVAPTTAQEPVTSPLAQEPAPEKAPDVSGSNLAGDDARLEEPLKTTVKILDSEPAAIEGGGGKSKTKVKIQEGGAS